jgi:glucose-1-phosphate thymidylyltransferase
VYIEDGVRIERSEIGPNVSLEAGTTVAGSRLKNTIVGRDAKLSGVSLDGSLLGNRVLVEGLEGGGTIGDDSEVSAKRSSQAIPSHGEGERRISTRAKDL